jgi:hypothetical protein
MSPNSKNPVEKLEEEKTEEKKFESLDEMIEVIEGDELRHVIGGGRPKTGPFA